MSAETLQDEAVGEVISDNGRLRTGLIITICVAVVVIAGGVGWLVRGSGGAAAGSQKPSATDIGFAQDMATHHTQAVTMAGIERDGTSDGPLRVLAFDIETGQQFQVGEMQGWLDSWDEPRESSDPMGWMSGHMHPSVGADGRMPGMATPAQMDKLVRLKGRALDVFFLQLMIHHHQGGIPMARYAVEHASEPYVRNLAQKMVTAQGSELIYMEGLLRKLGGEPLPPPT